MIKGNAILNLSVLYRNHLRKFSAISKVYKRISANEHNVDKVGTLSPSNAARLDSSSNITQPRLPKLDRGTYKSIDDPGCELLDVAELFYGHVAKPSNSYWNENRINQLKKVLISFNFVNSTSHSVKRVNGKHISMILYGLRSIEFRDNARQLSELLSLLNTYILTPLSTGSIVLQQNLTVRQIVMMLASFQHMKCLPFEKDSVVLSTLRQIPVICRLYYKPGINSARFGNRADDILTAQHVCNTLCNLQNFHSDIPEVCGVVDLITFLIKSNVSSNNNIVFDYQHIGNSLYGMRNLSSSVPQVQSLVETLVSSGMFNHDHIQRRNHSNNSTSIVLDKAKTASANNNSSYGSHSQTHGMTVKEISNALYGLQGMRFKDSNAVTMMVNNCIPYLKVLPQSTDRMGVGGQSIGPAVYGLQNLMHGLVYQGEAAIVMNQLLHTVYSVFRPTDNVHDSIAHMTPLNVATALYGLGNIRCMKDDDCSPELRTFIRHLAQQIATFPAAHSQDRSLFEFSSHHVSMSLYGLRNISTNIPEVCMILEALVARFQDSGATAAKRIVHISHVHMTTALYGLRHMNVNEPVVEQLLDLLLYRYNNCSHDTSSDIPDYQCISNALIGVQHKSSNSPVVTGILNQVIIPLLQHFSTTHYGNKIQPALASKTISSVIHSLHSKSDKQSEITEILHLVDVNLIPSLMRAKSLYASKAGKGKAQGSESLFDSIVSIASSLYGLSNCSSKTTECRSLVGSLARHIHVYTNTLPSDTHIEPQCIAMMLFGCRFMFNDCEEVEDLIESMLPLLSLPITTVHDTPGHLSLYQLCRCFYGVQNLTYVPHSKRNNANTFKILECLLIWFEQLNASSVYTVAEVVPVMASSQSQSSSSETIDYDYMDEEVEDEKESNYPYDHGRNISTRGEERNGHHREVHDIQRAMEVGLANLKTSIQLHMDSDSYLSGSGSSIQVRLAGNRNMFAADEVKEIQRFNDILRRLQKELSLFIAYRE